MPTLMRPKGPNEFQLSFLVPKAWLKELDELAQAHAQPGLALARSDILRMALRRGIDALRGDRLGHGSAHMAHGPAEKGRKR
jgi:hypothetical protein